MLLYNQPVQCDYNYIMLGQNQLHILNKQYQSYQHKHCAYTNSITFLEMSKPGGPTVDLHHGIFTVKILQQDLKPRLNYMWFFHLTTHTSHHEGGSLKTWGRI